jgi:hypothetical protein
MFSRKRRRRTHIEAFVVLLERESWTIVAVQTRLFNCAGPMLKTLAGGRMIERIKEKTCHEFREDRTGFRV